MSLFIVNRFDDNSAKDEDDVSAREEKRLRKLQKLIEKRKLERSIVEEVVLDNIESTEIASKANEDILLGNNIVSDPNSEEKDVDIELETSKKKRKRPIDEDENSPTENVIDETKPVEQTPKKEFKVLGVKDFERRKEAIVSLPHWLSNPKVISVDLKSSNILIDDISFLNDNLKAKLKSNKIEQLFPIQAEVVPYILKENKDSDLYWPKDICVSAPTGSGKTLAYVLPIVQMLSNRTERQIHALVILPVKELVEQVGNVFKSYCKGTDLKVLTTGEVPLSQEKQQLMKYTMSKGWQSEVDILVCTPGRLVAYLQDKSNDGFTLKHLQFLVIDEADRMMDHIQNDWLHHFNKHVGFIDAIATGQEPTLNVNTMFNCKRPPQKLFFSATFSHDPEKLKQWGMFQPKLFTASTDLAGKRNKRNEDASALKYTVPLELTEHYIICDVENKPIILYHLIRERDYKRILCFTNSSQSTHLLTILLNNMGRDSGINAEELSSSLVIQNSRQNVLKSFQNGKIRVLVCTDALARGIDITDCDLVISYDPPKNTKTYIHRIGRTARAGKNGTAIVLLSQTQHWGFKDILTSIEKSQVEAIDIDPMKIEALREKYEEAQRNSKDSLRKEKTVRLEKMKATKRGIIKKKTKKLGNKKQFKNKSKN